MRERPADVKKFFLSQLKPLVAAQAAERQPAAAIRSAPADDPYGF
jgi:hypothetical protein